MSQSALYSDLSHYYDLMCCNINYAEQCQFSNRIYNLLGNASLNTQPIRLLDLACGTGPHAQQFIEMGYAVSGLDVNKKMLVQAQLRCPSASFLLEDMCNFTLSESFDVVTCFLYSMHYCYPQANFYNALQCAHRSLCMGGLLIFDMVGREFVANDNGYTHQLTHTDGDFTFQSRWFDAKDSDKLDLFITITKNSAEVCEVWQDAHIMLAAHINDVVIQLKKIGFDVLVFNRDFTKLISWQGDLGNVILVCKKIA